MTRRNWTKEENEYLIANYGYNKMYEIAEHLGRPYCNVQIHASKILGLTTKWTKEQEEFLRKHSKQSNSWIAKKLGKKTSAVKEKRRKSGCESILDSRFDFYTVAEASRVSGISSTSIRRYSKKGYFKSIRCGRYRFIKITEFHKFLKNNPTKWDATKCESWIFDNCDWFQKKRKEDFRKLEQKRWGEFYEVV